jgi:hypothetical protein
MGVGGQRHGQATLPPGNTQYPLYRRLGGPQGQYGWVCKIWAPPGFNPQTVQPVASHYTDRAIAAQLKQNRILSSGLIMNLISVTLHIHFLFS